MHPRHARGPASAARGVAGAADVERADPERGGRALGRPAQDIAPRRHRRSSAHRRRGATGGARRRSDVVGAGGAVGRAVGPAGRVGRRSASDASARRHGRPAASRSACPDARAPGQVTRRPRRIQARTAKGRRVSRVGCPPAAGSGVEGQARGTPGPCVPSHMEPSRASMRAAGRLIRDVDHTEDRADPGAGSNKSHSVPPCRGRADILVAAPDRIPPRPEGLDDAMGRLCQTDGLTDDQTEILKAVRDVRRARDPAGRDRARARRRVPAPRSSRGSRSSASSG